VTVALLLLLLLLLLEADAIGSGRQQYKPGRPAAQYLLACIIAAHWVQL
jgi:hypothetical protein